MSVAPDSFSRRSPLYRQLAAAGATFEPMGDAAVAMRVAPENEAERLQQLAFIDLSVLTRMGLKGPGAPDWLLSKGVSPPPEPNRSVLMDGHGLLARLSAEEHLLLAPARGDDRALAGLEVACASEQPTGVYLLPRRDSHAWLRIVGRDAGAMFAKLCGVDLRPDAFAPLCVAQTQVARISAIIIRQDCGALPGFHLLFDSASSAYLWDCLIDAAGEFGGGPAGLAALLELDGGEPR